LAGRFDLLAGPGTPKSCQLCLSARVASSVRRVGWSPRACPSLAQRRALWTCR